MYVEVTTQGQGGGKKGTSPCQIGFQGTLSIGRSISGGEGSVNVRGGTQLKRTRRCGSGPQLHGEATVPCTPAGLQASNNPMVITLNITIRSK